MPKNDRRCISCRRVAPKHEFWRIVRLYPSHTIALDQGMGRSAYLCPHASCLQSAQKKNRLGRMLRAPVPESVYNALWQRLADDPIADPDDSCPEQLSQDVEQESSGDRSTGRETG